MLKISAPYRPRTNPREGWIRAGFVCGMSSPKLYTKCGKPLGGWWCIPSGILQSTRLQYSRRRLRWTNETGATDQNRLIILNSTSTRTFSNCNVMLITHEKCITNLHMTKKINLMDLRFSTMNSTFSRSNNQWQ